MRLYWVTTSDKYEDCFILAEDKTRAIDFFAINESYEKVDIKAKYICDLPEKIITKYNLTFSSYVFSDTLKDLGGFVYENNPRIVNINGKVYREKPYPELSFSNQIGDDPGIYVLNQQNTYKYKIGLTRNLKKRLNTFATGNAETIKLVYFIKTKH